MNPYLQFDFHWQGRITPIAFRDPVKIIVAHRLDEVRPAFDSIRQGLQRGLYAAGYVGYEAAPAFDPALDVVEAEGAAMPLLWFGLFREPLAVRDASTSINTFAPWRPSLSRAQYEQKVETLKRAIADGAVYQVNFTLRYSTEFSPLDVDDFALYSRLCTAQKAAYSAYLDIGRFRIVCVSPELFFYRRGGHITTRPMKGTASRGRWPEEDCTRAKRLKRSEKDRAENVMIVDLLRNDLGRISQVGSVHVPELFTIEHYPTVLQMTSTIEAEMRPGVTLADIFRALFPCGSVTGAPKIAATQFIANLEDSQRGVYCGAIGYATPDEEAIFNVAIRTVVVDTEKQTAEYGVGSGIVWDSTPSAEYEEIQTKMAVLTEPTPSFELLETMRLENGVYYLLDRHLARLESSANYFDYPIDPASIREALELYACKFQDGIWRIRLLLTSDGAHRIESAPLDLLSDGERPIVTMASAPVSRADRFLYHKTTHRAVYESRLRRFPDFFDVLLYNEERELTEFTRGNLIVELDGRWWTSPRESGLLAGTLRAELLDQGCVRERVLTPADLGRASQLYFVNSVRGIVPVSLHDFNA